MRAPTLPESTADNTTRLAKFAIDPERGFLPATDPLPHLPVAYAPWEDALHELPAWLVTGIVRDQLERLPQLATASLTSELERERAMLALSYLGHAYIFGAQPYAQILPAAIAVPWVQVARALRRPPVLNYATHILHNWQRLDPTEQIVLDNLTRPTRFLGGMDEDWFGMIHIALEAQAAPALRALVTLADAAQAGDVPQAITDLTTIAAITEDLILTLARMAERCDPYIYYHRVRPFLTGWRDNPDLPEGMIYSGVAAYGDKPQRFRGASGAQSSIIPAIDAGLGLDFAHDSFSSYLRDLERYMPPRHRAFIVWLRGAPGIRAFASAHKATEPALVEAYNACLIAMRHFREAHMGFAGRYIHAQSVREHSRTGAVGTGGTPFMPYLHQHAQTLDAYLL